MILKKMAIYFCLFVAIPVISYAQTSTTLTVSITNETGAPVSKAILTVKTAAAKTLATVESDSTGKALLTITGHSSFTLEISHISYLFYQQAFTNVTSSVTESVVLKDKIKLLDSINVTSKKAFIVVQPDRYIINVDGLTALGNNVSDILKRSPGIAIVNDQVTLEGKPVMLQIDGKNIPVSGKDLLNMLSSSAAANINQIELITTPPSSMDASFSGGVINLKLKKLKTGGYNGSFSASGGMRSRDPFGSMNGSINIRKGKLNIYANAGVYNDKKRTETVVKSNIEKTSFATIIDENAKGIEKSGGVYYTAGVDYNINKETIIGMMLTGGYREGTNQRDNRSLLFNSGSLDSIQQFNVNNKDKSFLNVLNLNFKKQLDSLGQEINIDLDYNFIHSRSIGRQLFQYMKPDGQDSRSPYELYQNTTNDPDLYGIKADYKKPFKILTLETGLKYARSKIKYMLDEERHTLQPSYKESVRDTFAYNEQIYAAYASITGKIKKLQYRLGLRGEVTSIAGNSFTLDKDFSRSYTNLFPNISVSQKIGSRHTLAASFRRSIVRPRFNKLNPFRYYTGPFYYYTGNPDLQPYFPYTIRMAYGYAGKIQLVTGYTFANNKFIEIDVQENNSNLIKGVIQNLGTTKNWFISLQYYDNLAKWWYSDNNVTMTRNNSSFTYAGNFTRRQNVALTFSSFNRFTLPAKFSFELFGYYSTASYFDVFYLKPFGYVDAGISKRVFKDKGGLSFKVNDLFFSNISRGVNMYNGITRSTKNKWDSRSFVLSFYYSFGNQSIERNRQRTGNTANSDERNRN